MDIFVLCVRYFATKVGLKSMKKCLILNSKMLKTNWRNAFLLSQVLQTKKRFEETRSKNHVVDRIGFKISNSCCNTSSQFVCMAWLSFVLLLLLLKCHPTF